MKTNDDSSTKDEAPTAGLMEYLFFGKNVRNSPCDENKKIQKEDEETNSLR